jgi:hypothetical protein
MSEQEGFLTDARTAELFFRVCKRYNIQHPEDRILLLRELAKRKKAKYLRDVAPWMAGKKVLKVGFKKPGHNDGPEHFCPECRPKEKPE